MAKRVPGAMGSGAMTLTRFFKESLLVNLRLKPSGKNKTERVSQTWQINRQI
jgi:hypothetical protein